MPAQKKNTFNFFKRSRVLILLFTLLLSFSIGYLFFSNFGRLQNIVRQILPKPSEKIDYTFHGAPFGSGFKLLNENKRLGFKTLVGKSSVAELPSARFEIKDTWIDFTFALKTTDAKFRKQQLNGKELAVWENILPDVDVTYEVKDDGLKEHIILNKPTIVENSLKEHEALDMPFTLTTYNVVPRYNLEGKLEPVFIDSRTGEYRFHLERPFLIDAKGERYDALEYELIPLDTALKESNDSTKKSTGAKPFHLTGGRVGGRVSDTWKVAEGLSWKGLLQGGEISAKDLFLRGSGGFTLSGIEGFLVESNPEKKESNQGNSKSNGNISVNSPNIRVSHDSNNSSILTVNNKQSVPNNTSTVNISKLNTLSNDPKLGTIKTAANQPAERFIDNPDNALSQGGEKNLSISSTLANTSKGVNVAYAADNGTMKQSNKESRYLLRLLLPREWLMDPNRLYPVVIDPTVTHNTQTAFATGTLNRVKDEGAADAAPLLTSSYHELPADIRTVGLWHMNENAVNTCSGGVNDVCDKSGNSNDLAFNGNAAFTTSSKLGASATTLDGTDDYLNRADDADFDFGTRDFTVEFWVNPTALGSDHAIVYKFADSLSWGDGWFIEHSAGGTGLRFVTRPNTADTSGNQIAYASSIPTGSWSHVAAVRQEYTLRLYVNGKEVASSTFSSIDNVDNAAELRIGTTSNDGTRDFNGLIDEVRISNIARTPEELKTNSQRHPYSVYTSPVMDLTAATSWTNLTWLGKGIRTGDGETPISTTNLVAQWNFNETSGTTAASGGSCGAACNGTLAAGFASTTSQDQSAGTGWTANNKRWGAGALMFDGSDDFVQVSSGNLNFGTGDFTLEAWVNTKSSSSQTFMSNLYCASVNACNYYMFNINNSTQIRLNTYQSGGTEADAYGTIPDLVGKWHHLVAVRSGTSILLYADGVLLSTTTSAGQNITNSNNIFYLGKIHNGSALYYFNGTIDSPKAYSRALSAAEILANYQAGQIEFQTRTSADNSTWEAWKPVTNETAIDSMDGPYQYNTTDTGLVSYWPMDETSGATVNDRKGTNNGTATGTTVADGKFGKGRGFNGSSDYINIPVTSSLNFGTGDFTMSLWFKPRVISPEKHLIDNWDGGVTANTFVLSIQAAPNPGKMGWGVDWSDGTFSGTWGSASTVLSAGNWYHAALVRNGTNMYLYLNGKQEDTTTVAAGKQLNLLTSGKDIKIGRRTDGQYPFDGTIDEVRIYNTALSAATINQYFNEGIDFLGAGSGGIGASTDTTTKMEGTGALRLAVGGPQVDANTVGLWHMEETSGTGAYIKDSVLRGFSPDTNSTLATNLVAYWKLNETSGTRFDVKGSNNLTDNNTVTSATGKVGNAAEFVRANSEYVSIPDNTDLSVGNEDFTIAQWVYLDTHTTNDIMGIFDKWNGTNSTGYLMRANWWGSDFRFRFDVGSGSGVGEVETPTGYSSNTWYFIVAWHDSTANTINVQVNNGSVTSTSFSLGAADNSSEFRLGKNYEGYMFGGRIDEVGFWKKVLTAQERTDLYNSGNGQSYGPNHGTPTGTTVVDGFFGKARSFNGTSDYITVPDSNSFDQTGNMTLEAWVKTSTTADKTIISNSSATGHACTATALVVATTGRFLFRRGTCGTEWGAEGTTNVADGKWHYVVGVDNGSGFQIYVDGILEYNSTPTGYTTPATTTGNLFIGRFSPSVTNVDFNGSIDEVRISNTARSAEEIAEAYRAGRDHRLTKTITATDLSAKTKLPFYVAADRPGTYLEATIGESAFANYEPDANTVGLWHLEEALDASGSIKDSSRNGNNGTLISAPPFVQGKIGKARDFDGTADYVSIGKTWSQLGVTTTLTYEAWVYLKDVTTGSPWIIDGGGTVIGLDLNRSATTGKISCMRHGVNDGAIPTVSVSTNQWYYISCTMSNIAASQSNTIKVYLNGELRETVSGTNSIESPNNSNINFGAEASGTPRFFTKGVIDEVRISNTARTADEIRQAFEVGKRTHPITIDFVSKPQAAYSSGTSVTILNPYGTANLTDTLKVGDTIIFKENVNGTETVGQAVVNAVANTAATYGTVTLAAAPAFPTGGYTTNATVFKWQREYFDLTGSLATQRDAITRLTMRVTDGSQGANVWLDDFRSNSSYLSSLTPTSFDTATGIGTYSTASIPSTLNRYFQYRAILSSWDTPVSPQLTSAALTWVSNSTPAAPTITNPSNGATLVPQTPSIALAATDPDSDYLRYKIQLDTVNTFNSANLATFDQTASQTGWSGQNAQTSTAYASGATATLTPSPQLLQGKRYFVRAYAVDPAGINVWSSVSTNPTFLTTGVLAGPCTSQPGGDYYIDESCNYTGSSEGVDAGNMTVKTGATFTLNANQSIVWNDGQSITIEPGASIAVSGSDAKLTQNYMYTASSGTSGYPDPIGFAGAVAVYHMDDASGTTMTGSTGSYNSTTTGTTVGTGKFGNARSFNGTSDYVSIGALTGSIQTVAFWIYPNTTSGEFADLNSTAYINAAAGTVSAPGFSTPTIYVNGAAGNTITAGSWQHIVVTTATGINASAVVLGKRGTSYFSGLMDEVYYFNRALSTTEIMGLYNPSSSGMQFMYQSTNPDTSSYRRRKDIVSAAPTVVGEWKLDEQSGTGAYLTNSGPAPIVNLSATDPDSDYLRYKVQLDTVNTFNSANLATFDQTASQTGWSGQNTQTSTAYNSGSTATYTIQTLLDKGTTYYLRAYATDPGGSNSWSGASSTVSFTLGPNASPFGATAVAGRFGYARSFNGTTDYLTLGSNGLGAMSGSFTIEAWAKTSTIGQQTIISEYQGGTCQDGRFYIQANTGFLVFDNGNGTVNTGNVVVNDGVWHHVAYVYNAITSQGKIYVDGIPGSDTTAAAWRNTCATTDVRFGSEVGANFFNGIIDNIRVYNLPISDVKMKQLYYSGFVTGCSTGAGYTREAACPACPRSASYADDGNCGKKLCAAC